MKSFRKTKSMSALLILAASAVLLSGCDEDKHNNVDNSPPSVPSGVYSVTGDRQVTLYWSPIVEDDFDYYIVWRSDYAVGPYSEIGTTRDASFVDTGLINGRTYYYAVSSVDFSGNESDLSYETVYDTPRPEGSAALKDFANFPELSGFSFANQQVLGYSDAACDIYLDYDDIHGVFLMWTGRSQTDIQDFGYTDNLDDVNYAPDQGWSELGYVEVILGHSYVVWTADNHFAKFRITSINPGSYTVGFDYAYQTDEGNGELKIGIGHKIKQRSS